MPAVPGAGVFSFGAPAPMPGFGFGSPSVFGGPIASTAYTAHLFGAGRVGGRVGGRGRGRYREAVGPAYMIPPILPSPI